LKAGDEQEMALVQKSQSIRFSPEAILQLKGIMAAEF